MWKYNFRSSFRNLVRQRYFAISNILGLAIGFTSFFYILQYVHHEKQYDSHIKDAQDIVRVTLEKYRSGEMIVAGAETYVATGPAFYEALPEVVGYTRTYNANLRMNAVITYVEKDGEKTALKFKDYYYTDSSFLRFFGYELLKGDINTALAKPNTAVITESLARIYFGDEDPIGKVLIYEDEDLQYDEHIITGVMADPPTNGHLRFRLLLSYKTFDSRRNNGWVYKYSWKARKSYTYLKLHPDAEIAALEAKIPELVNSLRELPEARTENYNLQRLKDIHFTQGLSDEPTPTTNPIILDVLIFVAFLILAVAIINYINLSISSLIARAGEVSVKKILGAGKRQLISQFFMECSMVNIFGLVISLSILYVLWPILNDLTGVPMDLNRMLSKEFLMFAAITVIICILLSGVMPAVIFASANPVDALKGVKTTGRTNWMRLSLIIGQFTISFCLIASALVVYSQLKYMQEQDLGVNIENTIVVRTPGIMPSENWDDNEVIYGQFLNRVQKHSAIKSTTASLTIPGHMVPFRTGGRVASDPDNLITLRLNGVNDNFFSTFRMDFIGGRDFKDSDMGNAIILTETAVEKFGFASVEEALGSIVEIPSFRMKCNVIGVVNDYRLESVKTELEPMAFVYNSLLNTNFFSLKIRNNASSPLDFINGTWSETFPGNPMEHFFMEDYFNKQYYQEQRLSHLFGVFSIVTVLLGGIGLLGLSTSVTKKLYKEIGIRKILGSSVFQIFFLISSKFIRLVILSSLLGIPVSLYLGRQWLEQFPIRVDISMYTYLIPTILIIGVALFSTGFQTIKAALVNPIETIKEQ